MRKVASRVSAVENSVLLSVANSKSADMSLAPLKAVSVSVEEIKVACKVGLIDKEQAWWWVEEWQKGERENVEVR